MSTGLIFTFLKYYSGMPSVSVWVKIRPHLYGLILIQTVTDNKRCDAYFQVKKVNDVNLFYCRLKTFRAKLFELFKQEHAQTVPLDKVKGHMGSGFSEDEIFAAIDQMMDANQVMLADDAIFLI